jgi:hypothetical protein
VWRESRFTPSRNWLRLVGAAPGLALAEPIGMFKFTSLLLLVGACTSNSGSGGSFEELSSEMEGIYRVTSHTRNEAACVPGGDSILGTDGFAIMKRMPFFGDIEILNVFSCASPADCRARLAQFEAGEAVPNELSFSASEAGPNGTVIGQSAGTGFSEGNVCTGGELTTSTFALTADGIRIETGVVIAPDYPSDDGLCSTTATQRAASGVACSEMEILEADFVESL